jgi:hypothetical protein
MEPSRIILGYGDPAGVGIGLIEALEVIAPESVEHDAFTLRVYLYKRHPL